jgi:hypothetical protein
MRELTKDELQYIAGLLIKAYKKEILKEGDWWFGIDDYDFNIHDFGHEGTGHFSINVYEHNGLGMDNYTDWLDLDPVYLGAPQ